MRPPQDPLTCFALAPQHLPSYSLERTLAAGFGLPALKHAQTASAITSIWR